MSVFSNNMKRIREKKGITKAALSTALNISASAIAFYEKGEREPNLENLKKIATYLNVTVDELLEHKIDSDELETFKSTWQLAGWQVNIDEKGRVHITNESCSESYSNALFCPNSLLGETIKKIELKNPIETVVTRIKNITFETKEEFIAVTEEINHKAFVASIPISKAAVENAILCKALEESIATVAT